MNQRDASRKNWSSGDTLEEINAGSLQRIADATETMAQNYTSLQNDRDWYKKAWKEACDQRDNLWRRISALKGVITRMKKKSQQ